MAKRKSPAEEPKLQLSSTFYRPDYRTSEGRVVIFSTNRPPPSYQNQISHGSSIMERSQFMVSQLNKHVALWPGACFAFDPDTDNLEMLTLPPQGEEEDCKSFPGLLIKVMTGNICDYTLWVWAPNNPDAIDDVFMQHVLFNFGKVNQVTALALPLTTPVLTMTCAFTNKTLLDVPENWSTSKSITQTRMYQFSTDHQIIYLRAEDDNNSYQRLHTVLSRLHGSYLYTLDIVPQEDVYDPDYPIAALLEKHCIVHIRTPIVINKTRQLVPTVSDIRRSGTMDFRLTPDSQTPDGCCVASVDHNHFTTYPGVMHSNFGFSLRKHVARRTDAECPLFLNEAARLQVYGPLLTLVLLPPLAGMVCMYMNNLF